MIGWLGGDRLDNWKQSQKQGIVLNCSGVGYEVQLIPRYLSTISSVEELSVWIHHIRREDGESLYGFETNLERDLFRKLIAVNGVGPQMAIALLEEIQIDTLISAIIREDVKTLSKAQGVGKRTAERLSIELRNKLKSFDGFKSRDSTNEQNHTGESLYQSAGHNELLETLRGLGYEEMEINKAISETLNKSKNQDNSIKPVSTTTIEDFDVSLKACLLWLSNESK